MRRERVLLPIVALLFGVVSVTAGCGGDGSKATPTPKAKATATATAGPVLPTATATPSSTALPTATPGTPPPLAIVNPVSGQSVDMIISVVVQAPDLAGKHLSIWVRPIPEASNQSWWAQEPPVETAPGTWKSDPVYIGKDTDPSGLPFRICAVVTEETYARGQQRRNPPEGPSSCVDVTRE